MDERLKQEIIEYINENSVKRTICLIHTQIKIIIDYKFDN